MITFIQTIDEAKNHLENATRERSLYCNACKSSRETLKQLSQQQIISAHPAIVLFTT